MSGHSTRSPQDVSGRVVVPLFSIRRYENLALQLGTVFSLDYLSCQRLASLSKVCSAEKCEPFFPRPGGLVCS